MDTIFAILHVATAVFIVGPMAILPMTALRLLRAGSAKSVASLATSISVFSLLSLLTFLFGFGVLGIRGWSMSATWVWVSVVAYLIALGFSLFVIAPGLKKAGKALALANASSEGDSVVKPAGYGLVAASSGIVSLLLVVTTILMVWRPL